jgi:hypothetical protein
VTLPVGGVFPMCMPAGGATGIFNWATEGGTCKNKFELEDGDELWCNSFEVSQSEQSCTSSGYHPSPQFCACLSFLSLL